MTQTRKIQKVIKSKPTLEGAGVHLKRAFGFGQTRLFDPFLLLDDFRGDTPADYIKGFPWHPHRGIETITYVLKGEVDHGDSMGNRGSITAGDVQWMTAGSGIIHQEMPHGDPDGRMYGFQLWANLPRTHKMMDPRYRDVKDATIPEVTQANGVKIRIICGEVDGQRGPVQDVVIDPQYLDVTVPAKTEFIHPTPLGHTVFAYIIDGKGIFCDEKNPYSYEEEGSNYFDLQREALLGNTEPGGVWGRRAGQGHHRRLSHPLPAHLRPADQRAGGLVRADCDEHQGRTADGVRRIPERDVYQI